MYLFFSFCGKFFGANIPPKHGGNKGRSRSLSDARATLTVPVLLLQQLRRSHLLLLRPPEASRGGASRQATAGHP